jgi:hypothetical protein
MGPRRELLLLASLAFPVREKRLSPDPGAPQRPVYRSCVSRAWRRIPNLPAAVATPAAYGDLIAALLALMSLALLHTKAGLLLLWAFNLWGTGDLLSAYYQGAIGARIEPGLLGATYFVPTVLVPLLLVTRFLAFRMLGSARYRAA